MNQLVHTLKSFAAALGLAATLSAAACSGPRSDAAPVVASTDSASTSQPPPVLPPPALAAPAPKPPASPPRVESKPESSEVVPAGQACLGNADCVVKDVGSCCGYQPRCLNTKAETFPARVRERCASEGRVGICGFREIAGCECVKGKCAAIRDENDGGVAR